MCSMYAADHSGCSVRSDMIPSFLLISRYLIRSIFTVKPVSKFLRQSLRLLIVSVPTEIRGSGGSRMVDGIHIYILPITPCRHDHINVLSHPANSGSTVLVSITLKHLSIPILPYFPSSLFFFIEDLSYSKTGISNDLNGSF